MEGFGPELEDGESYLPAGILLEEDGWGVAVCGGDQCGPRLLQHPRLFSNGVRDLLCHQPQLGCGGHVGRELLPSAMATKGTRRPSVHGQNPRMASSTTHLLQWGLWRGRPYEPVAQGGGRCCACRGHIPLPAGGRVVLAPVNGVYSVCPGFARWSPPVRFCRAQAEGDARVAKRPSHARFLPAGASGVGRECGGTGVFLPLYGFQSDSGRLSSRKSDGDHQKQKLDAAVAKKGMPFQPRAEVGLPRDWAY